MPVINLRRVLVFSFNYILKKGVPLVNRRCTKGVPFLSKLVHKRVTCVAGAWSNGRKKERGKWNGARETDTRGEREYSLPSRGWRILD